MFKSWGPKARKYAMGYWYSENEKAPESGAHSQVSSRRAVHAIRPRSVPHLLQVVNSYLMARLKTVQIYGFLWTSKVPTHASSWSRRAGCELLSIFVILIRLYSRGGTAARSRWLWIALNLCNFDSALQPVYEYVYQLPRCELLSIFVILIRLYSFIASIIEDQGVVNCSQSL